MTEKLKFGLGRVKNIVEKEKNIGYQTFSFFHNVFYRLLSLSGKKVELCGNWLSTGLLLSHYKTKKFYIGPI